MGVGLGAGVASGLGISGIFSVLKEIVDEAGDITQAVIEQLNQIKVFDRKVEKIKYKHYNGKVTSEIRTTDTYCVTLWEVLFLGLVFGVFKLMRNPDGTLGLGTTADKPPAWAGAFGVAGGQYPAGAAGLLGITYEEGKKLYEEEGWTEVARQIARALVPISTVGAFLPSVKKDAGTEENELKKGYHEGTGGTV